MLRLMDRLWLGFMALLLGVTLPCLACGRGKEAAHRGRVLLIGIEGARFASQAL
jgi:hypothetical protein